MNGLFSLKESSSQKEAFYLLVQLSTSLTLKTFKESFLKCCGLKFAALFEKLMRAKTTLTLLSDGKMQIGIGRACASAVLYELASTKSLSFCDKKVLYDPFSQAKFSYEVYEEGDFYLAQGLVTLKNLQFFLHECDWVFEGDKIFYLYKGVISFFDTDCDYSWIKKVKKAPLKISKDQWNLWIEKLKEDDFPPQLSLMFIPQTKVISSLPFLKLFDKRGLYADLWFDYEGFGVVRYQDGKKLKIDRNLEEEKAWEEDLLEAGYSYQKGAGCHYYCPLDKVAQSLKFLIELGWVVFDSKGREVKLLTDKKLLSQQVDNEVVFEGSFSFGEEKVDLEKVFSPNGFLESFVELSSQSVGLLEGDDFLKNIALLKQNSSTCSKLAIPKSHIALLEDKVELMPKELKGLEGYFDQKLSLKTPSKRFFGTLMDYQKKGFDWLYKRYQSGFYGLLADEMGLGKTVQVLALLSEVGVKKHHLIIVPASLKTNWAREIEKFLQVRPFLFISGHTEVLEGITIVSYGVFRTHQEVFCRYVFDTIVLDEAQTIKNPDSLIAQALCSLRGRFKLCITGTPIENKALDLWSLFKFLDPHLLGSKKAFELKQNDSAQRALLSKVVSFYLLRRKKDQVFLDLPERMDQDVYIELDEGERALYQKMLSSSKVSLEKSASKLQIFEILLRLRQICCHPLLLKEDQIHSSKLDQLIQDVTAILEERRKVLIFSQFTSMLSIIKKALDLNGFSYLYLDGSTQNRQEVVDDFQTKSTPIFLMSLKAGGVGLNITQADYVLIYDPWWNNAAEEQAIARAHRIGRKKTLFVKRYIVAGTIEEKIIQLKQTKHQIFSNIIDHQEELSHLSLEDLKAILD